MKNKYREPHCVQYAVLSYGNDSTVVYDTEKLTDEQIFSSVHPRYGKSVSRYNRCPNCDDWTTSEGKLRTELDCPAVQRALNI